MVMMSYDRLAFSNISGNQMSQNSRATESRPRFSSPPPKFTTFPQKFAESPEVKPESQCHNNTHCNRFSGLESETKSLERQEITPAPSFSSAAVRVCA